MSNLLPPESKIRLTQSIGRTTADKFAKLDHVIICLPRSVASSVWQGLPEGARLRRLARRQDRQRLLSTHLSNAAGTGVTLGQLPKNADPKDRLRAFWLLKFAGSLAERALRERPRSIGLLVPGLPAEQQAAVQRALALAVLAHAFDRPHWKSKPETRQRLRRITMLGLATRLDLEREQAEAQAINLTRWLTQLAPNKLDATSYRKSVARLARERGWRVQTFNTDKLRRLGAGAFLAVCQGNADDDACILRLQYRPDNASTRPRIALIGKGIIFDTGGNNLKQFKWMLDMHEDMAGSATALATLQALSDLEYPHAVDCWLAISENRIGAKAYKSRDVVTACNGKTIEVIHTDAEGRMVLADALALAGREKPAIMIDYATLTGSCVSALTERYSGVFTNRNALNELMIGAGASSGERVWPFPMDADYEEDIESKAADVLQCSVDGSGDHILAARFLQHFVPDATNWIHIDLSAANRKGGLAQIPSGVTGFGVRFTLNLLYEQSDKLAGALKDKRLGG